MKETVLKEFEKVFGDTDGVKVFFAPGRVNLIGEHTDITPDFENQVLQGKLSARGKLRIIHLAVLILKLLADKNVRITYQHFKKIKL